MTVEDQRVAHDGMGEAIGRFLGFFYVDDGMVVSRESEWIQNSMNVLVGIFRCYGISANVAKSCTMMCQSGVIRSGMSEESKTLKCTGGTEIITA